MLRIKDLAAELLQPEPLLELFLLVNVAGVGLDILLAHAVNDFENRWEWAPVIFSAVATVLYLLSLLMTGLFPGPARRRGLVPAIGRALGIGIGLASVVVGVAGLIFHLESQFFQEQTIQSLVYTAPFVAPLAYADIGLLIILNRMVRSTTVEWGRWVVLLTMVGFLGNFVLSLCDHAQNGFFVPAEWTGVIAGAAAVGILMAVFVVPDNRPLILLALAVMAVQVVVGLVGFGLHVRANLVNVMPTLWQKFVYGAPAFAPLLFADAATLAALGLWQLDRCASSAPAAEPLPRGAVVPG